MSEPEFYTVKQVAEKLQIKTQTVRDLIWRGELPAISVGRLWRIAVKDFDAYVKRSRL